MPDRQAAIGALVRKLNGRLIPILLLMYMMAFLNRTNLGFAKQAFQADTGISDAAFALAASIFFVSYAILEVPSNLMLHRLGARLWLARIMVSWGIVSAATAFVHTEGLFYALRILLGATEAGFFPGVILYMTYWYPPRARAGAMGLFYFGAPLASIFGGPLSGLLLTLDGLCGLHGWQWMFLVQGLAASCVGVLAWFTLTSRPTEAAWLSADEKTLLRQELADQQLDPHGAASLKSALFNPRVLLLAAIYLAVQIGIYGFTFFLPSQVAGILHAKVGVLVGFVSALPWACALAAVWLVPRWSDATGNKRQIAAAVMALGGVGLAASVLLAAPVLALGSLCLAAIGLMAVQPIFWTLPHFVLRGAAVAGGLALINSIGTLGGFVAPNLRVWADRLGGPGAGMLALGGCVLAGAALILLVRIPKTHN